MNRKLNIQNVDIYINRKSVILGLCPNIEPRSSIEHKYTINFIILYAKWFIHIKKKSNVQTVHISEFFNMLKTKLYINFIVAKHQNNEYFASRMYALIAIYEIDS